MTAYATPPPDPTAVVGRRITAWLIDLVIFLVIALGIAAVAGNITYETRTFSSSRQATAACDAYRDQTKDRFCSTSGNQAAFVEAKGSQGWVWPAHFVAYVLIQGIFAASIGKLIMGLRVVDDQGKPIGIGRSFVRTLLWIGDAFTCGLPIIGGVMMVSTKGHRRLGDYAAGTFVVPRAAVGTPVHVPGGAAAPAAWGGGAAAPPAWPGPPPGPLVPDALPRDRPVWDDARDTYIQFDASTDRWVRWSAERNEWLPIDDATP